MMQDKFYEYRLKTGTLYIQFLKDFLNKKKEKSLLKKLLLQSKE